MFSSRRVVVECEAKSAKVYMVLMGATAHGGVKLGPCTLIIALFKEHGTELARDITKCGVRFECS